MGQILEPQPHRSLVEAADVYRIGRWTESEAQAAPQQPFPLPPARCCPWPGWGTLQVPTPWLVTDLGAVRLVRTTLPGNSFHMHQSHKINCGETKGVKRGAREHPA